MVCKITGKVRLMERCLFLLRRLFLLFNRVCLASPDIFSPFFVIPIVVA